MDVGKAEDLFENLADSSPIGIFVAQKGKFKFVNRHFQEQTGYSQNELLGTDPFNIIVPEDRKMVREQAIGMLQGRIATPYEYRVLSKDGAVKWIMENVVPVEYNGRRATLGYFMDVTSRKQAELALRDSERRYRTLVETSPDAIVFSDAHGVIIMCNQRTAALYGAAREDELIGKDTMQFIAPEDHPRLLKNRQEILGEGAVKVARYIGLKKDGTRFPVETSVSFLPGAEGQPPHLIAIVRDDTERDRWEQQLAHLATHDSLTGLSNRRALEDALARSVARARRGTPSALLCMDVDNFKLINDTLGHAAGDRALVTLTRLLQSKLRGGDLLARIGGDEFAVLQEDTDVVGARAAAERIRKAVEQFPLAIDGREFRLALSIGMVAVDGLREPALALSTADSAMYVAKQRGGNQVHIYDPTPRYP